MKIYRDSFSISFLTDFQNNYIKDNMLFTDIETTGLSPGRDHIYCIGCGYRKNNLIYTELFFAEGPEDEPAILQSFYRLLSGFNTVITFNGSAFDLPFIKKRSQLNHILFPENLFLSETDSFFSVGLYREARRLKSFLELPSCRQKNIEQFLGCQREDTYTGGELIRFYRKYISEPDPNLLHLLLLHNFEDVKNMFFLTGILSYFQLKNGQFEIKDTICETEEFQDYLNIKIIPEFSFPQSIHKQWSDASLSVGSNTALIRFPLRHGTLKHFFPDPENYYYLPDEDMAIHRSVGDFVDPSHRKKATRKNCYITRECDYVTVPSKTSESYLKQEYNEKNAYLEFPFNPDSCHRFLKNYFSQHIR